MGAVMDSLAGKFPFPRDTKLARIRSGGEYNGFSIEIAAYSFGLFDFAGKIHSGHLGVFGFRAEPFGALLHFHAQGKAVNAGGVATSGLEMSQNAMHISWSAAEVDEKLHAIMHGIHAQCVKYGTEADGYINYVKGANIAGFMKVAHAMMGQGII